MSLSQEQIEILRENCDNKLTEKSDDEIRELQEESMLPPSLFMTYYLREEGIKLKNIADILGLGDKSAVGKYLNRIKQKKKEHEMTSKVFDLSEKTDEQKRQERKEFAEERFREIVDREDLEETIRSNSINDFENIHKEIKDDIEREFSVKLGLRTIQNYTKEVREEYE